MAIQNLLFLWANKKMIKEYKIVRQSTGLLKNNDKEFEKELTEFARQGWRVLNTVFSETNYALKVIIIA